MKNRQYYLGLPILLLAIVLGACQVASPLVAVESIAVTSSYQNPALLERAWQLPVAHTYQSHFEYQINPAFCGPATVVNLFNSLHVTGFNQTNLFDRASVSYAKARSSGLTLDELGGLIRDNAALEVIVLRDLTLAEFRAHLRQTNDPAFRYLINFNRQPLFGVKVGHHSPIGGYLPDSDLVFVLDVLEEYKPFLVSADRLYEAMDTVDSEAGKKRGLLRIGRITPGVASP